MVVVLACAGIAFAQMDPDEALQKLHEREAAAASQPSDPNSEIATLKSVVADQANKIDALKAQVAQLVAQNSSLKKQIAAIPAPSLAPTFDAKIWKGMTKAQITDALGKPTIDRTDSDGTETIEWNHLMPPSQGVQVMDPTTAWMQQQNAALSIAWMTKTNQWSKNHDITAELHDGKVTDFSDQQQN
jgi:hypothetical protein